MRYVVFIVAILAVSVWPGCARSRPEKTGDGKHVTGEIKPQEENLKAGFREANIVWEDEKGQRLMEARFRHATATRDSSATLLDLRDVEAVLYRNGQVASTLSASRVYADSRTRELRACGGVTINSAAGKRTISADTITWKSQLNEINGTGSVRLVDTNLCVTAENFKADTVLRKVRLTAAKLTVERLTLGMARPSDAHNRTEIVTSRTR